MGTPDIAMLHSRRIIIPPNTVEKIMKELHRAYSGIEKMYKTAVQSYFWPGMKMHAGRTDQSKPAQQQTSRHLLKQLNR